jgi:uncharacterized protein YjbJ (UPF0337 family)
MSGLSDKITGKAKQVAGDLTGDKKVQNEGKIDEAKGSLKDTLNKVVDTVSEKVDEVKKKHDK